MDESADRQCCLCEMVGADSLKLFRYPLKRSRVSVRGAGRERGGESENRRGRQGGIGSQRVDQLVEKQKRTQANLLKSFHIFGSEGGNCHE